MTTAVAIGCTLLGVDAIPVRVEVDMRPGLPLLAIVGLPDRAVAESARRVRAALANAGFRLPPRRITVNLAPADLPKHGAGLDLPIAAALLVAAGHAPAARLEGLGFWGQLSLDGNVAGAPGALPAAICYGRTGLKAIVAATSDAPAARLACIPVYEVRRLSDLAGREWPPSWRGTDGPGDRPGGGQPQASTQDEASRFYVSIKGLHGPKRALRIAAAGGHSLVLLGPPGVGKSLLARALHALLPPLSTAEMVDVARIASASGHGGQPAGEGLKAHAWRRPLRAPSSAAGLRAMFGGGSPPAPGEVTLAHAGLLILDELPLFKPEILAGVSRALDARSVSFAYHLREIEFPAGFQLAGTANLCPCGRTGSLEGGCGCTPAMRRRHYRRMCAQLLDRVDLHLEVTGAETAELLSLSRDGRPAAGGQGGEQGQGEGGEQSALPGEGTAELVEAREAVLRARERQSARFGDGVTNTAASQEAFDALSRLSPGAAELLDRARAKLGLSARGCLRVLRVARTAADLEQSELVEKGHVAEAVAYRWRAPDV